MTRDEIDKMWNSAVRESYEDGTLSIRYRFAAMVADAEAKRIHANTTPPSQPEQEPVAWLHPATNQAFTSKPPPSMKAQCWALVFADTAPPPRQPLTGGKTTFAQRFTDAVAILCGSEPPAEFVNEWLINAEVNGVHRLQEWVCTQGATPQWAQGIVVLDAAHVLATSPEEGEQHEAEHGITKAQP